MLNRPQFSPPSETPLSQPKYSKQILVKGPIVTQQISVPLGGMELQVDTFHADSAGVFYELQNL